MLLAKAITKEEDLVRFQSDVDGICEYSAIRTLNANLINQRCWTSLFGIVQGFQGDVLGNNTILESVETAKYLSMILDSHLRMSSHVSHIVRRAYTAFNMLRSVLPKVSPSTWTMLYSSYIRSILEYCSLSWQPNKSKEQDIERVQRLVTRFIISDTSVLRL